MAVGRETRPSSPNAIHRGAGRSPIVTRTAETSGGQIVSPLDLIYCRCKPVLAQISGWKVSALFSTEHLHRKCTFNSRRVVLKYIHWSLWASTYQNPVLMLLAPLATLSIPSKARPLEIRPQLASLALSIPETGSVYGAQYWVCKVVFLWPLLGLMILKCYHRVRTRKWSPARGIQMNERNRRSLLDGTGSIILIGATIGNTMQHQASFSTR